MQTMKMMYYPFVHPPRPVLWQALLYWDELTSISPQSGYQFGSDLKGLQDLGLYKPTHPDDLPSSAHAALDSDLRQVVAELPGEDLVPVPGPLGPYNRLYWGKLPIRCPARTLLDRRATEPQDGMFRISPVLLSRLMVVLAKHLAAANGGMIPFTDSPSAYQVAFTPLGSDLPAQLCWQLQIGEFLPVPADDTPLVKVLMFREAYNGERDELAGAVRKLLVSVPDPVGGADPAQARTEDQEGGTANKTSGTATGEGGPRERDRLGEAKPVGARRPGSRGHSDVRAPDVHLAAHRFERARHKCRDRRDKTRGLQRVRVPPAPSIHLPQRPLAYGHARGIDRAAWS